VDGEQEANIAGVEDFLEVSIAEDASLARLQPLTFLFVPLDEYDPSPSAPPPRH
jgi:hypothetical protein